MRLPTIPFFIFGMGSRHKFLYRGGELLNALSGDVLYKWHIVSERIVPAEYRVNLSLTDGTEVSLWEDEEAVWLEQAGLKRQLSRDPLNLPSFAY